MLIEPVGTQKYEMIAHTHNSPASNTYSVFSFSDLRVISNLLRRNKIDNSKFVCFLSTADGTNYAFTIDDPVQFLKVFALLKDVGYDQATSQNRSNQNIKYFDDYNISPTNTPLIVENSTSNLDDEKYFLDFISATNLSLTLFEVNNTFDSFEKVSHNTTTGNIDKITCN
ncbi:MAG: hypothetical protein V3U80_05740 [Flavobacteriaceae bacterium]